MRPHFARTARHTPAKPTGQCNHLRSLNCINAVRAGRVRPAPCCRQLRRPPPRSPTPSRAPPKRLRADGRDVSSAQLPTTSVWQPFLLQCPRLKYQPHLTTSESHLRCEYIFRLALTVMYVITYAKRCGSSHHTPFRGPRSETNTSVFLAYSLLEQSTAAREQPNSGHVSGKQRHDPFHDPL